MLHFLFLAVSVPWVFHCLFQ